MNTHPKHRKIFGLLGLAPLAALLTTSLAAQEPSAYDGLLYSDDTSLVDQSGGIGWDGDWGGSANANNHATITSDGLTFTKGGTLPTEGGAVILDGAAAGGNVNVLRSPSNNFANDSFWVSSLIQLNSSTQANALFRVLDSNDQTNRIFINHDTTDGFKANLLSDEGPNQNNFATNLPEDQAIFLVMQVDRSGGTNGTLNAWINPDIGPSSPQNSLASASLDLNGDTGQINNLSWLGANNSTHTFDEMRLGDSFEAVTAIPEPGTYALFAGLGALALLVLRRRNR